MGTWGDDRPPSADARGNRRPTSSPSLLLDSASRFRAGGDAAYRARVLRTKTYVTQEATRLCAELFALGGGRHYVRGDRLRSPTPSRALRPPLPLALDALVEGFALD